jgi:diguanylate cyclase (GGDEF)-like protein
MLESEKRLESNGILLEAERARRFEVNLSVVLVRLDNLEGLVRTYGQKCVESIQRESTELVRGIIRRIDVFGLWTQTEMVILTLDKNVGGSAIVAEKIRSAFSGRVFVIDGCEVTVSVSIGLARGVPENEGEIDSLVDTARNALNEAEKAGGDQIIIKDFNPAS